MRRTRAVARRAGSGVIDSPVTSAPNVGEKSQNKKKKPPIYKVLLHNDPHNRRAYVVGVLVKVVKTMAVDDAVNVMNEAHQSGLALVTACAQDEAELYVVRGRAHLLAPRPVCSTSRAN